MITKDRNILYLVPKPLTLRDVRNSLEYMGYLLGCNILFYKIKR